MLGGITKKEDIKKEIEYKMDSVAELFCGKNNNNIDKVKQESAIKVEQ